MPAHEIKLLSLTDVFVESSFLVLARNMGTPVWVHTWGILILGNPAGPILVDTGASHPEIMERLGMKGRVDEDMQLENALAATGSRSATSPPCCTRTATSTTPARTTTSR